MWTATLASLLLFTLASAKESPAVAVRPDWTNIPQGQRILPRINDTAPLDGAKRKEIVYGPYSLGGGNMLSKFNLMAKAPCSDCFVTAIQATARYASGQEVMTSDGVWLHHAVLTSLGRARASTPLGSTVLWAGGNERPTVRLNTRYKYGIDWPGSFSILVEFMSEIEQNKKVSLAITYEYIEKELPQAKGYRDVYMRWNSVGTPDPQPGQYKFDSPTWTVPMNGVLLQAGGHMHDGGTSVDLYINDQLVCSSKMYYGGRAGYGSPAAQQHGGHAEQMNGPQQPAVSQQQSNPRPASNLQPQNQQGYSPNARPNNPQPRPQPQPQPQPQPRPQPQVQPQPRPQPQVQPQPQPQPQVQPQPQSQVQPQPQPQPQPNPQPVNSPQPQNQQVNSPNAQPNSPQPRPQPQPQPQPQPRPQPQPVNVPSPRPVNPQQYAPPPQNQVPYNPNFQAYGPQSQAQPLSQLNPPQFGSPQPSWNSQPYYYNAPSNGNNQPFYDAQEQPYNNQESEEDDQEPAEVGRADRVPWVNSGSPNNGPVLVARDGPHGGFGGTHISDPGVCSNFLRVKEGDKMRIVANYDSSQHQAMTHQGDAESLMGNMRVWIGPDEE